jgi:DNA gyrase subunit B/topoisomerase-4 subunit B
MSTTYTAKDITVLEGLEPVRKRPGMYIGGVGAAGLHHLVWETLDNAVDEAMNGHATTIAVTLHADGASLTVADDGRGIPVDRHPKTKQSALEVIFTVLHAGGKFEAGNYKTAGGLHGVGASVVNALSKELVATVKRDGSTWEMRFKQGKPTGPLKNLGPSRGSGTTVYFHPDPTIFPKVEFDPALIRERLEVISYIHKGVKVTFENEATSEKEVFQHEEGLVQYLEKIVRERGTKPVHDAPFTLERFNGMRVDVVLQWTESTDEHLRSYANGIPTGSGGTHENGLRAGVGKAVRNFIETHNLSPKGVTLTAEDIREGLTGVLSVFLAEPQFQGQTKDRLNNPELLSAIDSTVRPALEHWMNHNISVAEAVVARIILAARAREASRAAQQEVTRKTATSARLALPGKLTDCSSNDRDSTEIFIVEGDSAGGSAKQGRDRIRQAILPLRGKVLNTESASLAKVLENKELSDLVIALGCGLGKNFDLSRLRYGKVIILADADSDGHHIATLLLTFMYRHMPQLMANGRVYLAQPPLYRIDIGKETFWALDDPHKADILSRHGKGANGRATPEITRFKGLGEMMPKVLWETTLNPKTRRLLRVDIADQIVTDRVINELMGKDASARFRFIMERAEEAEELDL